jgi:hypothetical protein
MAAPQGKKGFLCLGSITFDRRLRRVRRLFQEAHMIHPTYAPAHSCETFRCSWRGYQVEACIEKACPHTWQRTSAADKAKQNEFDRKERRGKYVI